uniref:VLRF1 domain-containing protein n=1 Tax=Chelydra serpentina TaxID=8475 RepID=A0A8C3T278_CHESE
QWRPMGRRDPRQAGIWLRGPPRCPVPGRGLVRVHPSDLGDHRYGMPLLTPFPSQTEHYRLDWHRFNLKQRLLGRRALAAEEFEEKTRAGDVSSISGSDSDDSDSGSESDLLPPRGHADPGSGQQSHRSAKVLFRNSQGQLLSAYRCVLGSKKASDGPAGLSPIPGDLVPVLLPRPTLRFLSPRPEVLDHKTFHRYTVRARRGTGQGLRDAQGQAAMPRSAGASLRRYNEAALLKDIQDLLAGWAQHLQAAQRIFLRAPRANRALLFGGRSPPLHKGDPRVCNIPFSTRRATFREVLRVHAALATLQVYGENWGGGGWGEGSAPPLPVPLATRPEKGGPSLAGCTGDGLPAPIPPVSPKGPSEEEGSPAGELETVEVTLGTLQLREFEVMPKRSRKRRKKRDKVGRGENGGFPRDRRWWRPCQPHSRAKPSRPEGLTWVCVSVYRLPCLRPWGSWHLAFAGRGWGQLHAPGVGGKVLAPDRVSIPLPVLPGAGARTEGPGGHEEPEHSAPQPGAETVADPQEGPGAEPAALGKGGKSGRAVLLSLPCPRVPHWGYAGSGRSSPAPRLPCPTPPVHPSHVLSRAQGAKGTDQQRGPHRVTRVAQAAL